MALAFPYDAPLGESTGLLAREVKLNSEPDEILSYFGYGYESRSLTLPQTYRQLEGLNSLKQSLEEILPCVSLTSEMARREFLIAANYTYFFLAVVTEKLLSTS